MKNKGPEKKSGDRSHHEPGQPQRSWSLKKEDIAQTICALCMKPFKLDGAGGVRGGMVVLDEGNGKKSFYHGYERDKKSDTCWNRYLKSLEGGEI